MIVTCPACGRKAAVSELARDVVCDCGRRFDPAARPTVADPFLGRELMGYRVEEMIGGGVMGTVYRATQLSLGRLVALKVLPPNVSDDPEFLHRFHREAEILAALSHPNVVQVIDRGESDGRYFIVMEYVDGESLRSLLKRGPVPARDAFRICAQLLEALDYAHAKGVVHRDIKPENVLLSRDGIVKVADFGVSRFLEADPGTRLTRTHFVLGTYEYMSPEQRESVQEADGRSDIYATAVVLYEMLTGELPIGRFDLPSRKLPQVDRRIDGILERGLAKDPSRRYGRASQMARELAALASAPGIPRLESLRQAVTPPKSFELRIDLLLTVLAVTGILLAIGGIALLFEHDRFEVGLYELDRDASGIVVLAYGVLLWRTAERARRFRPSSRPLLLALTALLAPTLVGLPITAWASWVLLGHDLSAYYDARVRGLGAVEAAALAQGLPLAPASDPTHLRAAGLANRWLARGLAALAFVAYLVWMAFALDSPSGAMRDEQFGLLVATWVAAILGAGFALLARRVERGSWLHANACVWTCLTPFAPRVAARAREIARKDL